VPLTTSRSINFEISISVEYVDDRDPTMVVGYPTHSKRVVMRARTPDRPSLGQIVRLERVVAFDPIKAEAEYELQFGPLLETTIL
jgi:hypothetical protein